MNDADRIRLAEARGWTHIESRRFKHMGDKYLTGKAPNAPEKQWGHSEIPDPEHDANDDYAVLLAAREKGLDEKLYLWIGKSLITDYEIGDFGRGYLKMLDHE